MLNPFIELARDPVGVLSAVGYCIGLVGLLVVGVPHALRCYAEVAVDWRQNARRPGSKWERFYGDGVGYLPPTREALKVLWASLVLFVSFEAVAALLWFLGVEGVA